MVFGAEVFVQTWSGLEQLVHLLEGTSTNLLGRSMQGVHQYFGYVLQILVEAQFDVLIDLLDQLLCFAWGWKSTRFEHALDSGTYLQNGAT